MQRITRRILIGFSLMATTFTFLLLPALSHAGIQPEPFMPFGMVGLARLQTARLNVVNLHPPEPGFPPSPCVVMLGFVDSSGHPLLNSRGAPIMKEVRLMPGEAAFLDLTPRDAFGDTRALRLQFRATMTFDDGTTAPPSPCALAVPTLEIFDNFTGRTRILYESSPRFVIPPDDGVPQ